MKIINILFREATGASPEEAAEAEEERGEGAEVAEEEGTTPLSSRVDARLEAGDI